MRRVALVCTDFGGWGGLATKARFLMRVLRESGRYEPEVFDLAVSSRDEASVLLADPRTWLRGPRAIAAEMHGDRYTHVGAWFAELEFQRYRPRRALEERILGFDLIQFVVGIPPWIYAVVPRGERSTFLYLATMTRSDRASRLARHRGFRRVWMEAMTALSERIEPAALRRADHVFAVSRYTRDAVARYIDDERITLAPVGVDTELYHPGAREDGYILAVGRHDDSRKNTRNLLASYAALRRLRPAPPPLYLVGGTLSSSDRAFMGSMGLNGCVRIFHEISRDRVTELFRGATLLAHASDEEGLGIVILEAMASGIPVVSTACGGPATTVLEGETGFLVPVRDPTALAERMDRLLGDCLLRRRMGERARQVALDRYSIAAAGSVILSVYDRFLR